MRELVVRAQATHYLFHRKGEKTFFCPQKIKQKKSNETYKQLGNYFFSNGIFSRAKLENGEDFHSQKEGKVARCRAKPRVFGGWRNTFDYSCQQKKKTFPSTSLVNQHSILVQTSSVDEEGLHLSGKLYLQSTRKNDDTYIDMYYNIWF